MAFAQSAAKGGPRPDRKLKLLILGGTGFIGPHIVNEARERGHEMTLFNRGRSNPDLFELETLIGDRDPRKDDGLSALEAEVKKGRKWDGVVDTSGYVPRIVKASASLLADHAAHYVFISSVSVYADQSKSGLTEDDPVGRMEDATVEEMGEQFENYGPLKALCEEAAAEAMGGRVASIRPGFIVGPRDPFPNRFNLWVMRMKRRERIIAPGSPSDPVQFIDARDLARFVIDSIERKIAGTFNAVGPRETLGMGAMIDGLREGIDSDAEAVWIPTEFLAKHGAQYAFIPWVPREGDEQGLGKVSNARAVAAGMTFTPVRETAKDTLEWFEAQPAARQQRVLDLLRRPQEDEVLRAWQQEQDQQRQQEPKSS